MLPLLRSATPADLPSIDRIVEAAYTPYIARIGRKPGPMLDDRAGAIAAGQVHVVEQDGVVRGLLVLVPQEGSMLLDNVAVDPGAKGTGLGRLLLEFAEQAARDAGYGTITLYTNEAMTENLALYARIGYFETHRAVENGLRRVYMAKTLSGLLPI